MGNAPLALRLREMSIPFVHLSVETGGTNRPPHRRIHHAALHGPSRPNPVVQPDCSRLFDAREPTARRLTCGNAPAGHDGAVIQQGPKARAHCQPGATPQVRVPDDQARAESPTHHSLSPRRMPRQIRPHTSSIKHGTPPGTCASGDAPAARQCIRREPSSPSDLWRNTRNHAARRTD